MYIEVFLLDNLLMNLLILRLAAALLSARPPLWRQLAIALSCAAASALAAYLFPVMKRPVLRLPLLLLMAFSFEVKSVRGLLACTAGVMLATLIVGGCSFAAALAAEGFSGAGITLRAALLGAVGASFLPSAARRMLRRRLKNEGLVNVTVLHAGILRRFVGFVDTGNTLCEPLSGLPVIILRCRAFERYAVLPIPAVTAAGKVRLMGFRPERISVCGNEVDCFAALTRAGISADALVPPALCGRKVK